MTSLGVLAIAAAAVSYSAQYRMVYAAKSVAPIAALEAGIPDVAALVFATLGIALALHGRRAIRARLLNVGAVGTSIAMNVLAAGKGWPDLGFPLLKRPATWPCGRAASPSPIRTGHQAEDLPTLPGAKRNCWPTQHKHATSCRPFTTPATLSAS